MKVEGNNHYIQEYHFEGYETDGIKTKTITPKTDTWIECLEFNPPHIDLWINNIPYFVITEETLSKLDEKLLNDKRMTSEDREMIMENAIYFEI